MFAISPSSARFASLALVAALAGGLCGMGPLGAESQDSGVRKASESLIPKVKPATPNDLDFRPGALRPFLGLPRADFTKLRHELG